MGGYIAIDTESDGPVPWSLQVSIRPGTGIFVLLSNHSAVTRLVSVVNELVARGWSIIFHHVVADMHIAENIGIVLPVGQLHDTMQESYQIGNLPQGLKALAYRQLGLRMRSWEDVVMPPSRRKMVEWLTNQWLEEEDRPVIVERQLKTKLKLLQKPNEACRKLKRILSHSHKPAYDLWGKAKEAGLVGYPIPSIAHTPLAEALVYANADADCTGRIGIWLEAERTRIVNQEWSISEGDQDV